MTYQNDLSEELNFFNNVKNNKKKTRAANTSICKAALNNVTSAMCKHQQRFGQLYIFNGAFIPGWTSNEFPAFANILTLAIHPL